jgi:polysaccharide pyruvyl transferase WcaK-like protein
MKRALLFGAYANGNIGDTFQANSLARGLKRADPAMELFATSASSIDRPYQFEGGETIPDLSFIKDAKRINRFSALVVGGGGLLASKHRPLEDAAWVRKIRVPIFLCAVGASQETVELCRALVESALVVTVRDAASLRAIRKVRPDATLLYDPILADPTLDDPSENPGSSALCTIPRRLETTNRALLQHLNGLLLPHDTVLSFFPTADEPSGALDLFKGRCIVKGTSLTDVRTTMTKARLVVSQRYHGCILALKWGIPCLGMIDEGTSSNAKITELYRQLGHEHLAVPTGQPSRQDLFARAQDIDFKMIAERLRRIEKDFRHGLAKISDAIPSLSDAP